MKSSLSHGRFSRQSALAVAAASRCRRQFVAGRVARCVFAGQRGRALSTRRDGFGTVGFSTVPIFSPIAGCRLSPVAIQFPTCRITDFRAKSVAAGWWAQRVVKQYTRAAAGRLVQGLPRLQEFSRDARARGPRCRLHCHARSLGMRMSACTRRGMVKHILWTKTPSPLPSEEGAIARAVADNGI